MILRVRGINVCPGELGRKSPSSLTSQPVGYHLLLPSHLHLSDSHVEFELTKKTDENVVKGLSPWRPQRPKLQPGNAEGPRLAPSGWPVRCPGRTMESRSHAPARLAGSTPASQTSCPGTSAKCRHLWTSPGGLSKCTASRRLVT